MVIVECGVTIWPVGRAVGRYKDAIVRAVRCPEGGLTLDTFICSGSACFIAQQSCERLLKDGIFSPRHLKEHSESSLYLSPSFFSLVAIRLSSLLIHPQGKKDSSLLLRNVIIPVSFGQDIVSVSLGLNCSRKRHFRGHHTVLSMKDSQMLTSSPEGLRLCLFFSPSPAPPSFLCNIHYLAPFTRQLVREEERWEEKEGEKRGLELEKRCRLARRYNARLKV